MASTHKSLRSGTANKRPTTSIADGQIALNTNSASPGLFFKDSTGATIIKIGPVHVGTTAPNVSPATGGSAGNSTGEVWLDTSLTPVGVKIWDGSAWQNATPSGSTTVQGLLELATNAETQTGSDTARAVTPAGLQSKVSDSTSTTSSTTIASSTAVKAAYDLANAALPKSGGTVTGNLEIGSTGSLSFEGATADAFETTIAVTDPTADRTITLPDQTGSFLVSGNASIVNADVNASAAIAGTKISPDFGSQNTTTTGTSTAASFIPTSSTAPANGMYLSAANTLAFNTNTAASPRLVIDSSGRLGLGTSSPQTLLHLNSATGTSTTLAYSENNVLKWYNRYNASDGSFQVVDVVNSATRLHVSNTGNVGIGTTGPERTLHVSGEAVVSNTNQFLISPTTNNVRLYARDATTGAQNLSFNIGTTEAARFDTSGRLGIGTTSPLAPLHVVGKSIFTDWILCTNTSRGISSAATEPLVFGINETERARIDSSGRLLVGTSIARSNLYSTSFASALQLEGNTNTKTSISVIQNSTSSSVGPNIVLGRNNSNTDSTNVLVGSGQVLGRLSFQGNDATNFVESALITTEVDGTPGANSMPGRLVFCTASNASPSVITERLRIDSSGRVGIGTTSPSSPLSVVSNSGALGVAVNGRSADNLSQVNFYANNGTTLYGRIQNSSTAMLIGSANDLTFGTGGSLTERLRIDSSGRLLVGTSSSLGNGILQAKANSDSSTGEGILLLAKGDSATAGQNLGQIKFTNSSGNQAAYITGIAGTGWGGAGSADYPGVLTFATTADGGSSPTERVRIDNAGNVGINVLSPSTRFHVDGAVTVNNLGSGAGTNALRYSTSTGRITYDASSARYKDNIRNSDKGLADLMLLKSRKFEYKDSGRTDIGLVAEEVVDVIPELVTLDADGLPEAVNYDRFVSVLIKSLQQATERIETLEAKVAVLEAA